MTRFADRRSEIWARLADLVRRVRPSSFLTALRYRVEGYPGETDDVEVMQGFGVAGRPPDGADAECVAVAVEARDHHVVVACRDADTLSEVVGAVGLGADETLIYTSQAIVKILADGSIEVRSVNGTAQPLAYKADADAINARVTALEAAVNAAFVVLNANVAVYNALNPPHTTPMAVVTPASTAATVTGTTVLKGE